LRRALLAGVVLALAGIGITTYALTRDGDNERALAESAFLPSLREAEARGLIESYVPVPTSNYLRFAYNAQNFEIDGGDVTVRVLGGRMEPLEAVIDYRVSATRKARAIRRILERYGYRVTHFGPPFTTE
jgi:hypothetical protein